MSVVLDFSNSLSKTKVTMPCHISVLPSFWGRCQLQSYIFFFSKKLWTNIFFDTIRKMSLCTNSSPWVYAKHKHLFCHKELNFAYWKCLFVLRLILKAILLHLQHRNNELFFSNPLGCPIYALFHFIFCFGSRLYTILYLHVIYHSDINRSTGEAVSLDSNCLCVSEASHFQHSVLYKIAEFAL